jgi:hypothetical protein
VSTTQLGFPLTTSPWIPVVDTAAGFREVGIVEALARAHELRLAADAQEEAVLLRLLLAVYDAAAGPASSTEWDAAWRTDTLDPQGRVTAYLDAAADRFDLFHPAHPAFQCGHLDEYRRTPDVLDPAYLGGEGGALFNPALRSPADYPPHPPARAARYLLVLLGYDVAGIKGAPASTGVNKTFGARLGLVAGATQLHVQGRNLKEAVLLNLPPRPREPGDAPVWERECPKPGIRERRPTGRLDYLTWSSRRIRLHPDADGKVNAVAWHDGDRVDGDYSTAAALDPMTAWRATRKGGVAPAVLFDEEFGEPQPWAVTQLLHPYPSTTGSTCGALEHVVAAAARGILPSDLPLRVRVSSTVLNRHLSTIVGVRNGRVDLGPVRLHTHDTAARRRLAHVAHATAAALEDVRKAAERIAPHSKGIGKRVSLDPMATTRAWQQLIIDLAEPPADLADLSGVDAAQRFGRAISTELDTTITRLPLRLEQHGQLNHEVRQTTSRYTAILIGEAATSPVPADTVGSARTTSPSRRGRPSPEISIAGETKTLAQWAADPRCQVTKAAFKARLDAGWPPRDALTTPRRQPQPTPDPARQEPGVAG